MQVLKIFDIEANNLEILLSDYAQKKPFGYYRTLTYIVDHLRFSPKELMDHPIMKETECLRSDVVQVTFREADGSKEIRVSKVDDTSFGLYSSKKARIIRWRYRGKVTSIPRDRQALKGRQVFKSRRVHSTILQGILTLFF